MKNFKELFDFYKVKTLESLPYVEVEHVGASSIPELNTKGDLDIQIRVEKKNFQDAVRVCSTLYVPRYAELWNDEFALFCDPDQEIKIDIMLTAMNSAYDSFYQIRDAFKEDRELLERYKDLKKQYSNFSSDDYRKAKHLFFRQIEAELGLKVRPLENFPKDIITHSDQQKIWDKEHQNPTVLKQMDSALPSSGIVLFWNFLKETIPDVSLKGLEMGCGKGRNVMWLATQGVDMYGFDFSPAAITEAQKRNTVDMAHFVVHDALQAWPYESNSFDFGIDCFASTDIESGEGREFAIKEFMRVLKPGGYLLAYLLSTDDEFHKEMIAKSPINEKNAFLHSQTGKYEKTFDEEEISKLYKDFDVVKKERVHKTAEFFGKEYQCHHFWVVLQKKG